MAERIIPEYTEKGALSMHLKRYEFASAFCKGRVVLDAACGAGYGTSYLAGVAKSAVGLDIDPDAINYASGRNKRDNARFMQMDISKEIRFPDKYFDVICSFETIEHLPDADRYLREIKRALKDGGVYFLSTPFVKNTDQNPRNAHHYREYSMDDIKKMLKPYFSAVQFYGQRRKANRRHRFLSRLDIFDIRKHNLEIFKKLSRLTGNVPFGELSLDDIEIVRDDFSSAHTIVALCGK